jgi:hypothetical protein
MERYSREQKNYLPLVRIRSPPDWFFSKENGPHDSEWAAEVPTSQVLIGGHIAVNGVNR